MKPEDLAGWVSRRCLLTIYIGSYGGYAALVGATFTPDLFCCALDIVGISNLITWIETIAPYWSTLRATLHKRIGHPGTEQEFLTFFFNTGFACAHLIKKNSFYAKMREHADSIISDNDFADTAWSIVRNETITCLARC